MSRRDAVAVVFVILIVALPISAAVRVRSVCAVLPDFPAAPRVNGECFTGHLCRVGLRGDWLDLTVQAKVVAGGAQATVRITGTGTNNPAGECVAPKNAEREGYVLLGVSEIINNSDERKNLNIEVVGPTGTSEAGVFIFHGDTFLSARTNFRAVVNVPITLSLTGRNLDSLRLLNPQPGDTFLPGRTSTALRVRLTFPATGTISLEDRLQFPEEPKLNRSFGWPSVAVMVPVQ